MYEVRDANTFKTFAWWMVLSRDLTADEWSQISERMAALDEADPNFLYDTRMRSTDEEDSRGSFSSVRIWQLVCSVTRDPELRHEMLWSEGFADRYCHLGPVRLIPSPGR